MSFFKIEQSGCRERKGLVQVRYDLYWDEKDPLYKLTETKIYPEGGYPGKLIESPLFETGSGFVIPADKEDYRKWEDSLPTKLVHNPFIPRFAYFEPTVTDEEIVFVGELKLILTVNHYPNLSKGNNIPFQWRPELKTLTDVRVAQVKATNFTAVSEGYSVR